MHVEGKDNWEIDIEALQQGDPAAFKNLYRRFEPKLYAFTLKLVQHKEDAEEVVQEVFLKVWEKRETLDPTQNLDGYLFRIARNLVYNKAKHQVYEFAYSQYLATQKNESENFTENAYQHQELNTLFENICAELPPVRKQVFLMSRAEGLTNSEIAEILHTSNSNVENHINKALKVVREKFKNYDIIYVLLAVSALLH